MIPAFATPSDRGQKRASLNRRPCTAFPLSRTRAKSRPSRRWADFGNRNRSGGGVAGKVNFDTLRQEALASPLAAAVQCGAPGLGRHARSETKLLLARPFGRLVGAFHKIRSVEPGTLTQPAVQSMPFLGRFRQGKCLGSKTSGRTGGVLPGRAIPNPKKSQRSNVSAHNAKPPNAPTLSEQHWG